MEKSVFYNEEVKLSDQRAGLSARCIATDEITAFSVKFIGISGGFVGTRP